MKNKIPISKFPLTFLLGAVCGLLIMATVSQLLIIPRPSLETSDRRTCPIPAYSESRNKTVPRNTAVSSRLVMPAGEGSVASRSPSVVKSNQQVANPSHTGGKHFEESLESRVGEGFAGLENAPSRSKLHRQTSGASSADISLHFDPDHLLRPGTPDEQTPTQHPAIFTDPGSFLSEDPVRDAAIQSQAELLVAEINALALEPNSLEYMKEWNRLVAQSDQFLRQRYGGEVWTVHHIQSHHLAATRSLLPP